MFASKNLHNFRVALVATEQSDFDWLVQPCCIISKVRRFFSRSFTIHYVIRDSRLTISNPNKCSVKSMPLELLTSRAESIAFAMSFSEVISSSASVQSNVFATTTDIPFLWFAPILFRMLKRTLTPKFAVPFFDGRNTQVDGSIHKHSPCGQSPFFRSEACWLVLLSWKTFSCRGPFSEECRRGELDGRDALPFPLPSLSLSGSCFVPLLSPRGHWPFLVHCTQSQLLLFPFPLDLPLAAAAPEAAFCMMSVTRREMLLTYFLHRISHNHIFMFGPFSRFTFFEQYLDCTETAMASAVLLKLTVISIIQKFLVGLLSHRDMDSSRCVLNDCTLSCVKATCKISLKSKTDSSVSLTLQYS